MWRPIYLIFILFTLPVVPILAQSKVIHGVVRDKNTDERIPFAAVQFIGTAEGTTTGANGEYTFRLNDFPGDSLLVHVIGYGITHKAVDLRADSQTIDFDLVRKQYTLSEFVIHAGVNPALILLKKIIKHKPQNDPNRLSSYKYKVYNKLEVDLDNINREKFAHSKLLKPFAFIFNNMDTTSEDQPFLPVFLTETLSNYYYQKQPKKNKEVILASRTSGIKNKSFTQFLGTMYQNINVYDNFIPVFDKQFVSPISNVATAYYKYNLVDTQYIDNRRCFHVTFEPRRKGENDFFGDFWVNDTTFAIQKMNMQVVPEANINFVHRVSLVQEYKPLGDTLWFLVKDKFVADFTPIGEKKTGLIGRKTTSYYDIAVNDTAATNIFDERQYKANNIYIRPNALEKPDSFWTTHRYGELSKNEKAIYAMMDTLQKMPLYHTYSSIIQFVATGTKAFGPIELGPYYYLLSTNDLEKVRLRFDMGTTPDLFKDIYLHGYVAYGFGDRQFKGSLSGLWLLHRHPRMYLYGAYTHDLDNGGLYEDQISTDNIFTLAIRKKDVPQKFVMVDEKRLEFYKEGFSGFSMHWTYTNTRYNPYAPLPEKKYFQSNTGGHNPLDNSEINLTLRFAWREKFLEGNYYRISLGSPYPIVTLDGALGMKGVFGSSYNYQKLKLSVSDNVPIPPLGNLYYNFYAGQIFGTLPYLILEVHPGNELYYYDSYAFDMMNRYEFLSDRWAGFNIEHEIGGGIFNYIPWVRKLKLRQFWTAKGVIGSLSNANKEMNFKGGYPFKTLEGSPYLELGTGVENILHFLRIDFVWRVLPKPQVHEPLQRRFGIFGSFKLQF
ncbi:MAG TPA: DUF5686 family protein [Chitinophagaceae bacterium]|nr:DUF5686 family protein [Chitinophagaceae bacterium]